MSANTPESREAVPVVIVEGRNIARIGGVQLMRGEYHWAEAHHDGGFTSIRRCTDDGDSIEIGHFNREGDGDLDREARELLRMFDEAVEHGKSLAAQTPPQEPKGDGEALARRIESVASDASYGFQDCEDFAKVTAELLAVANGIRALSEGDGEAVTLRGEVVTYGGCVGYGGSIEIALPWPWPRELPESLFDVDEDDNGVPVEITIRPIPTPTDGGSQ